MAEDLDITEVAYTKLQIDQQRIDDDAARDLLLNAKVSVQTLGSPTGTARLGADGRHDPIEIPFTDIVEIDDIENVTTVVNPKPLKPLAVFKRGIYTGRRDAAKKGTFLNRQKYLVPPFILLHFR